MGYRFIKLLKQFGIEIFSCYEVGIETFFLFSKKLKWKIMTCRHNTILIKWKKKILQIECEHRTAVTFAIYTKWRLREHRIFILTQVLVFPRATQTRECYTFHEFVVHRMNEVDKHFYLAMTGIERNESWLFSSLFIDYFKLHLLLLK